MDVSEDLAGAEEDVATEEQSFLGYCDMMLKSYAALQSYRETLKRLRALQAEQKEQG
jgi:hypothetical protein